MPRPKRISICLAIASLLLLGSRRATAQPAPVTQRYQLEATLNPTQHSVHGKLTLAFSNNSAVPLQELLFHLYLNAFRDKRSVFMRESGGRLRGTSAEGAGRIELSSLRIDGKERLPDAQAELLPDDLTQLRVPLAEPLVPGASTEIEVAFESHLPKLFARSGYVGSFFAVAQWFPKLAKLEPDGHFEGFPYHGLGEFYADFADYELRVRTPSAFQVGACGELKSERPYGKSMVERVFRAERVHDMAWFASPDLTRTKQRMGAVDVVFLRPPGYDLALIEHANVVKRGLAHFGARFGAYPYKTLTVVIPPRGADGGAGMEYPTLIVTDGSWLPAPFAPSISGAIVTAHELAHQWFYGLLASNELQFPVLDEGLSEWASLDLMRALYGRIDAPLAGVGPDRFDIARSFVLGRYSSTSPGLSAPSYSALEYATSVYGRAALALESIRRAYGRQRFDATLARYAKEQRFGHPTPAVLGAAFDAVYGPDFATRVLKPLLLEGEVSEVRLLSVRTQMRDGHHITRVHARRDGKVALPTWLAAYDIKGRQLARKAWPADANALQTSFETDVEVARVVADPDRALLLDHDTRDQVWVLEAPVRQPWLSHALALAQLCLAWLGP